jgi:subtilase family serine protease
VFEGSTVDIKATIKNIGNGAANTSIVKFYDGDPAKGGTMIDDPVQVIDIKPRGSRTASVRWEAKGLGVHAIYVVISDCVPAEANLNNNQAFVTIEVTGYPDLQISSADILFSNDAPGEGTMVDINVTVHNVGNMDATMVLVRFLDGTNQFHSNMTIGLIAKDGGTVQASVPWNATPLGVHTINILVDPANAIQERREDNNNASRQISVVAEANETGRPDLTLSAQDIVFSHTPIYVNGTVTITANVHNIGKKQARDVAVRFLSNGTPMGPDVLFTTMEGNGGIAQALMSGTFATAGDVAISLVIDPANAIDEEQEDNNRAQRTLKILINATPSMNHPPRFVTTAPTCATAGLPYVYEARAVDDDGDPISYALVYMIKGTDLDKVSGRLDWTPEAGQAGDNLVILWATDNRGGTAEQSFVVHVSLIRPGCTIISPTRNAAVSGKIQVIGDSTQGAVPVTKVLIRFDGGPWQEAKGTLGWSFTIDTKELGNGPHTVEARSLDNVTESVIVSVPFVVENGKDEGILNESPWCIWIIIAAVVVAVLLGIYVMARKDPTVPPKARPKGKGPKG